MNGVLALLAVFVVAFKCAGSLSARSGSMMAHTHNPGNIDVG